MTCASLGFGDCSTAYRCRAARELRHYMRQEKIRKVVTNRRKQFGQALADSSSFMCRWSQSDAGSAMWGPMMYADVCAEGWPRRERIFCCIDEQRQQMLYTSKRETTPHARERTPVMLPISWSLKSWTHHLRLTASYRPSSILQPPSNLYLQQPTSPKS